MPLLLILIFIAGYLLIAFEQLLKVDKAAVAILTGVVCWILLSFGLSDMPVFDGNQVPSSVPQFVTDSLFVHLGSIAEILFSCLGP